MRTLIRTIVAVTTVVAVASLGPLPAEAAAPGPGVISAAPQGWWCRLTHLC